MNMFDLEDNLSLKSWTKTKSALLELQDLLKCNGCSKLPELPQYIGSCEHFFCDDCTRKYDSSCPVCKIPVAPSERKPDTIVRGLVSSVSDMLFIIGGTNSKEKISDKNCGNSKNSLQCINNDLNTTSSKNPLNNNDGEKGPTKEINSNKRPNLRQRPEISKPPTKISKLTEPDVKINSDCRVVIKSNDLKMTPTSKGNRKLSSNSPSSPAVDKRNMKGETPLHTACIKGDLDKIKILLENDANPNTRDNAGWTPLHEACSRGFKEIAVVLLENGAFVDAPGSHNLTPLHDAVLSCAIPVISLLRQWGANDLVRDIWGRSPRSLADATKDLESIHHALNTPRDESLLAKEFSSVSLKKMVLMDSGLSPPCKVKFEKVARLLKVKVVSEFSSEVTHIIVSCEKNQRVCQRTIKYMTGVVAGKWILSSDWLDECLSTGNTGCLSDYEIEGTRLTPKGKAPSRARINSEKMFPGLLSGCHISFCGNFDAALNIPSKKDLEMLVKAGDGFLLQREPNPEAIDLHDQTVPYHADSNGPLGLCSHFCIYPEGPQEPQLKYDMPHMKTLPLSWLYDCIDSWSLLPPANYK